MRTLNTSDRIEQVRPADLKAHPRNPRRGNAEKIAGSIRENGFWGGIIVQKSTGYVLVGNHRLEAARKENAETVPVIYVDVDDAQALRILLADNRASDGSTYDNAELAAVLEELQAETGSVPAGSLYSDADLQGVLKHLAKEGEAEREGLLDPRQNARQIKSIPSVRFEKWELQLADEDADRLRSMLDRHTKKHGTTQGFMARILAAVGDAL